MIYLRRNFEVPDGVDPENLRFWLAHDEDVEVYINGVLALKRSGYSNNYGFYSVSKLAAAAIKSGNNTLAVSCRQTSGGQFIDVGLVELQDE